MWSWKLLPVIFLLIGLFSTLVGRKALLCLGRLVKEWGLGGLNKPHSILKYDLYNNKTCKAFVEFKQETIRHLLIFLKINIINNICYYGYTT